MISRTTVAACGSLAILTGLVFGEGAPSERRLSRSVLEDKVRGGWAGQMIGVAYGAPTEFRSNGRINEGPIDWAPGQVENAIHQDDLYVEMTFAAVMDRLGLDATSAQYGEMFKDSEYRLWHANAGARRNLNRGLAAPLSGDPRYNIHANDIDFQIESDFIGLMCPGLPREANRLADRVGRVMNHGDGLYGGMFFGGMYAAAFFETDPRRIVEQGLRSIPAQSGYARAVRDVLAWHAQDAGDWRATWHRLEEKWDRDDPCPDGALAPFNIDARLNGAYVVLGLLYGGGDLGRTLEVSTRAGQDSDCNPSSAAGILGVVLGYEGIPDRWKSGIPALARRKFEYTDYSYEDIVASTLRRAEKVIVTAGGRVEGSEVVIPLEEPEAPPLEQWDPGPPVARVGFAEPAWRFEGPWQVESRGGGESKWKVKAARQAGAEATFTFDGTGVELVGAMGQDGGRADVFVDGERSEVVLDAWIPERTFDNDYWHVTGLAPGRHVVRLVVRKDASPRSSGSVVALERAIVYGARPPAGGAR
jgi:hypothetical protein